MNPVHIFFFLYRAQADISDPYIQQLQQLTSNPPPPPVLSTQQKAPVTKKQKKKPGSPRLQKTRVRTLWYCITEKLLSCCLVCQCMFNSLPNDKILDDSKLKVFAEDKINVAKKLKFVLGRVENMGKGENAGYQHFLLFPRCFQKAF